MRTDRLLRLADLLEADAVNPNGVQFDLNDWGHPSDDKIFKNNDDVTVDCGTAACAFGLAAISGIFKDEGLGYEISSGRYHRLIPRFINEQRDEFFGFEAAKEFFDISIDVARKLFDVVHHYEHTTGSVAELAVAGKIRNAVDKYNS